MESDGLRMTLGEALRSSLSRRVFSSGCPAADELLDGGFATREMVEIYGASTSGKTQLAFQAAVVAAGEGASVTFVDTEGTFRPERLAMIAKWRGLPAEDVLRLVFWKRATTVSEQMSIVRELEEDRRISGSRLVVIDTVGKNLALEYGGQAGMLERQSLLDVHLNSLARDAYLHDRVVLLTSRVASVGEGPERREVDIGGSTLRRFVHKVIHLERKGSGIVATLEGEGAPRTARLRITDGGVESEPPAERQ